MICFPNAKINIGLHVLNKREDGFHNLESLFYPVPIYDALEMVVSEAKSEQAFTYQSQGLIVETDVEKNLIYKAWKLLSEKYELAPVSCSLYKNIPMGAGLGGGSADAAFSLTLLNKLFNLNIDKDELLHDAAILGSDCPFFIQNKPSFISGRGEVIEEYELNLKGYYLVLVKPDIHISTAMAFSGVDKRGIEAIGELRKILSLPIQEWRFQLINDFEKSIFPHAPEIKKIKADLYDFGAVYASMSGSGSSVYGLFSREVDLKNHFKNHFYFGGLL